MRAPERIETERLILRRPLNADADAIFRRYASDAEVTRYMAWPTHGSVEDTMAFLAFSEAEWHGWPGGPYLIELRETGELLGGTGLMFDSEDTASTGYILARDAWGKGYASEAVRAMISLARELGIKRLYAHCYVEHQRSRRVLEKAGFISEGVLPQHAVFPNLGPEKLDSVIYGMQLES